MPHMPPTPPRRKKRVSKKAIAANRRNALLSTGPRTAAGRQCQYRLKIPHSAGRKGCHPPEKMVESFSRLVENETGW